MSSLDSNWMSCRQSHRVTQNGIPLLPQFRVPPGVTDFSIENKPPHLPDRNSPSRTCTLLVVRTVASNRAYLAPLPLSAPHALNILHTHHRPPPPKGVGLLHWKHPSDCAGNPTGCFALPETLMGAGLGGYAVLRPSGKGDVP